MVRYIEMEYFLPNPGKSLMTGQRNFGQTYEQVYSEYIVACLKQSTLFVRATSANIPCGDIGPHNILVGERDPGEVDGTLQPSFTRRNFTFVARENGGSAVFGPRVLQRR